MLYTIIKNIFDPSKFLLVKSYYCLMEVKTDTKEKFHVIRVNSPQISAIMAAELNHYFLDLLKGTIKNIVLNLSAVKNIDEEAAELLVRAQQKFYEEGASFIICELNEEVESFLDSKELLELMNITPTESEAGDIVQMEEIERELNPNP